MTLRADRGIRDTKAPPTSSLRGYGLARQAQDSAAFSVDGGGYAAQVGRFGAPNPTSFYSGADCALQASLQACGFLPPDPDESGLCAPIGESGYEVAEE